MPIPPKQLHTEQLLIGTLLTFHSRIYQYDIKPSELVAYGHYLEALQAQYQKTNKVNRSQLATDILKDHPHLDAQTLNEEIIALGQLTLDPDAQPLVDWLKNASEVRHMVDAAQAVIEKSSIEGIDSSEIYALLNASKEQVNQKATYQTQTQVVDAWIKEQKQADFDPTGLHYLDEVMEGGLYAGNVYGLAGYAKAGKTLLAGTMSGNMAATGVKHLYVAMEMGAGAIESRNIARNLGMYNNELRHKVKSGQNPITVDQLNDSAFYLNAPGITWEELKQQMMIATYRDKVKGFIIDYWQLLSNPSSRTDNHQYWADAAQGISNFCKRHNVWCVLVAQLNDDGKTLGSRGLIRACDMLLNIEMCEGDDTKRWLKMVATRYTAQEDLWSKDQPYLQIDPKGPYMRELQK